MDTTYIKPQKPKHYVKSVLDPKEIILLQNLYPEYDIKLDDKPHGACHAYAAESRNIAERLLCSFFPQGASICDVGGNVRRHLNAKRHVHCDNPILSTEDRDRKMTRKMALFGSSNSELYNHLCHEVPAQECNEQADCLLFIHSLYDISTDDLFKMFSIKRAVIGYAVINRWAEGDSLYNNTIRCSVSKDGRYVQKADDGSSLYSHRQDPNLYLQTREISNSTHTLTIKIHMVRGDQVFLQMLYGDRVSDKVPEKTTIEILTNKYKVEKVKVGLTPFGLTQYRASTTEYLKINKYLEDKVAHDILKEYKIGSLPSDLPQKVKDAILKNDRSVVINTDGKGIRLLLDRNEIRLYTLVITDQLYETMHDLNINASQFQLPPPSWNQRSLGSKTREVLRIVTGYKHLKELAQKYDPSIYCNWQTLYPKLDGVSYTNAYNKLNNYLTTDYQTNFIATNALQAFEDKFNKAIKDYEAMPECVDAVDRDLFNNINEYDRWLDDNYGPKAAPELHDPTHKEDWYPKKPIRGQWSLPTTMEMTNRTQYLLRQNWLEKYDPTNPEYDPLHKNKTDPRTLDSQLIDAQNCMRKLMNLDFPYESIVKTLTDFWPATIIQQACAAEFRMFNKDVKEAVKAEGVKLEVLTGEILNYEQIQITRHDVKMSHATVTTPHPTSLTTTSTTVGTHTTKQPTGSDVFLKNIQARNDLAQNDQKGLHGKAFQLWRSLGFPSWTPSGDICDEYLNWYSRASPSDRASMDKICDLSSMNLEASIFLKREHLFKKVGSIDFVKAHTVVHFNKTVNLLITPLVDFFKKKLTACLKKHNIIYTDGIDINNLQWKAFEDADIYESDLTAQDAKQGPTSVDEILSFYKHIGFPKWSINMFLRLYKFEAVDRKSNIRVKNAVAKATGGPDTGFGNLVNNLLIHCEALFSKAHLSSVILGDDLASQFKRKHHKLVLEILERCTKDCGTENKPFWNRAAFEFCSRVGVLTTNGTYRFYPNVSKVYNSLNQTKESMGIFDHPDEHARALSTVINHAGNLSFLEDFKPIIVDAKAYIHELMSKISEPVLKEVNKVLSAEPVMVIRTTEEIGAYFITNAEQMGTDKETQAGVAAECINLCNEILNFIDQVTIPEGSWRSQEEALDEVSSEDLLHYFDDQEPETILSTKYRQVTV